MNVFANWPKLTQFRGLVLPSLIAITNYSGATYCHKSSHAKSE